MSRNVTVSEQLVRIMLADFKPWWIRILFLIPSLKNRLYGWFHELIFSWNAVKKRFKNVSEPCLRINLSAVAVDHMFPCTHWSAHMHTPRTTLLRGLSKGLGTWGFMLFTMIYAWEQQTFESRYWHTQSHHTIDAENAKKWKRFLYYTFHYTLDNPSLHSTWISGCHAVSDIPLNVNPRANTYKGFSVGVKWAASQSKSCELFCTVAHVRKRYVGYMTLARGGCLVTEGPHKYT